MTENKGLTGLKAGTPAQKKGHPGHYKKRIFRPLQKHDFLRFLKRMRKDGFEAMETGGCFAVGGSLPVQEEREQIFGMVRPYRGLEFYW
jgi:hypothetical protein